MLDVNVNFSRSYLELQAQFQIGMGLNVLVGPSGSGKSTLLQTICGFTEPDDGFIHLDQQTLYNRDHHINLPIDQRKIGIILQDLYLFDHLDVKGNIRFAPTPIELKREGLFEELVDILELKPLLKRRVAQCSGGEKKRIAFARTIYAQPRFILLDEPFNGLDAIRLNRMIQYLERIKSHYEIPMLLVSHEPEQTQSLCDNKLVIANGRVTLS